MFMKPIIVSIYILAKSSYFNYSLIISFIIFLYLFNYFYLLGFFQICSYLPCFLS